MIEQIEDYYQKGCGRCDRFDSPQCSALNWSDGLLELRAICLSAGLIEQVKWGHPCFMHADRNIAIIGAFKDHYRLSFFEAGLMQDPHNILQKQGAFAQVADMIRFEEEHTPSSQEDVIKSYLIEAMEYAEKGLKAPKIEYDIDMPEELIDALDFDLELAEAFYKLTKGRQKSYLINLSSAKKSETRINRIKKFRAKILMGKGVNEY